MLFRFTVKNIIQSLWYIMKLFTSWEAGFISYHLSLLVPGSAGPVTSLSWRTVLPVLYHCYLLSSRKRPRNQAWKTIKELRTTLYIFFLSFLFLWGAHVQVLPSHGSFLCPPWDVHPDMDVLPSISFSIADIHIWHKTCLTYLFI